MKNYDIFKQNRKKMQNIVIFMLKNLHISEKSCTFASYKIRIYNNE